MIEELDIPAFARIEITLSGPSDLPGIAAELRRLADELDAVTTEATGPTAMLVAYHKIKATSKKLRIGH